MLIADGRENNHNGKERVTLKEIADLAGVSVSTASAILANKTRERRISDEAAQRVREFARAHDYTPNLLVRSLRRKRTNVLSFYSGYGPRHPNDIFLDRILGALQLAAGEARQELLLHCDYSRPVDATYEMLKGGLSDGLLYYGPQEDNPLLALLRRSSLPTVILNRADDAGRLSSVAPDFADGVRQVADLLVSRGHRRIAAVEPEHSPTRLGVRRSEMLRAELAARGVALQQTIIYKWDVSEVSEQIVAAASGDDAITALFCWNDTCGYKVLDLCLERGIDVPGRLSVVGFDGLQWPSRSPLQLTSVQVPLERIAREAVAILRGRIEDPGASRSVLTIPVTLLPGETIASPAPEPHG
jgi:DNA-binding LacI/PurR family transcriptional regulator